MDKQARLAAILNAVNEYAQQTESLQKGAEIALSGSDWLHLKLCADKLIHAKNLIDSLNNESIQLQQEIEEENRRDILEVIA